MRIITAKGRLFEVSKVEPLIEKSEVFNGSIHINREVANNTKAKSTGLRFYADKSVDGLQNFTVGNIPVEKVQEIQHILLEKGYYDFSAMEYQPDMRLFIKTKIDGGVSLPYFEEIWFDAMCIPVGGYNTLMPEMLVEAIEEDMD